MSTTKRPRGRPPRIRAHRLASVSFTPPEPPKPRAAAEIAGSYRRIASTWPSGVGTNVAERLHAIAAALDVGEAVRGCEYALATLLELEAWTFAISPLLRDGIKKRAADRAKGRRGAPRINFDSSGKSSAVRSPSIRGSAGTGFNP